uniref:Uncharacterized protein n=1 Tax=Ascaris lumbricoides TaxID=6252 RepID=A0A0M3HIG9_ASCLU
MKWDMALRPDSVACILFHRDMDSLLFVKQFRPGTVFLMLSLTSDS